MKKLVVMMAVLAFGVFAMAQGNTADTTGAPGTATAPTTEAAKTTGDMGAKDDMKGKKTAHKGMKKHHDKKAKTEGAM